MRVDEEVRVRREMGRASRHAHLRACHSCLVRQTWLALQIASWACPPFCQLCQLRTGVGDSEIGGASGRHGFGIPCSAASIVAFRDPWHWLYELSSTEKNPLCEFLVN